MKTEDKNNVIPAELTSDEIWAKTEVIRRTFAPNLTPVEFKLFTGLGYSLGANPYNREIWAVKYGDKPAQIFLGRDFYRRKAQEQEEYEGHVVRAVYENDDFKMVNGQPEHTWSFKDRGQILGAYCLVHKKGKIPFEASVKFEEYYSGMWEDPLDHSKGKKRTYKNGNWTDMSPTTWDTKDETMLKKVAEAQGLRGAFQGIFKGTYDESEGVEIHAEATVVSEEDEHPDKPKGRKSLNELLQTEQEKADEAEKEQDTQDDVDPTVNGQVDPDPKDDPAPSEKEPEPTKKEPVPPVGKIRKEGQKPEEQKPKLKKGSEDWDAIEKDIQDGVITVKDVLEQFDVAKPFQKHFQRLQAEARNRPPKTSPGTNQGELL